MCKKLLKLKLYKLFLKTITDSELTIRDGRKFQHKTRLLKKSLSMLLVEKPGVASRLPPELAVADPGGGRAGSGPLLGPRGRPTGRPVARSAGAAGRLAVRPEGPQEGSRQSRLLELQ